MCCSLNLSMIFQILLQVLAFEECIVHPGCEHQASCSRMFVAPDHLSLTTCVHETEVTKLFYIFWLILKLIDSVRN